MGLLAIFRKENLNNGCSELRFGIAYRDVLLGLKGEKAWEPETTTRGIPQMEIRNWIAKHLK